MKIHNSDVSIFMGNSTNNRFDRYSEQNRKENKQNSIYAGDLTIQTDNIIQKRKEAMKKALNVIGDAFEGDRKIDDDLEDRRNKIKDLTSDVDDKQQEINKLYARKAELKQTYEIAEDSQEQKDLELLEKRRDSQNNPSIQLTDEEKQQLDKIDYAGMTEYQQCSLEIDALIEPQKKEIDEKLKEILIETKTIDGIKLARLKTHPMIDANNAADKILNSANSQIIGMLIDESKDHIDQKMEEEKEAADKQAEEKEEQDEKLESIKEKKEAAEALTNKSSSSLHNNDSSLHNDTTTQEDTITQILNLNEIKNDVQKEVQDIIDKMKLLQDDIKGAAVDTVV